MPCEHPKSSEKRNEPLVLLPLNEHIKVQALLEILEVHFLLHIEEPVSQGFCYNSGGLYCLRHSVQAFDITRKIGS